VIATLARLDPGKLEVYSALEKIPAQSVPLVAGTIELYLPLAGLLDAAAERARISGELEAVESQIRRLETLLSGPFAQRAPADVVAREKAKLEESRESMRKLEGQLSALG
jgi:valyl-tRNA synthetase